jgi:hypothetical protein
VTGVLRERNGALFVLYETTLDSEPKIFYRWWRVQRTTADHYGYARPSDGDSVRYAGSGHWHATEKATGRGCGSVYTGDGSTQAEHVEEVSAPAPKVRRGVEVRWASGRWEKLLKRGWVPA